MSEHIGHILSDQRRGPTFSRIVEGQPIEVQDRDLIPLVRVTGWVKRRASLRGDAVGAHGYGFVHVKPVGIVERDGTDECKHAIHDATMRILWALVLASLLVSCASILLVHLGQSMRQVELPIRSA